VSRVLVTGGLGFIGSHLVRRLLRSRPDADITVVDNLSGTRLDWSDIATQVEVVIDDLRDFEPGVPFDEVWHLASPVGSVGILGATGRIAEDIITLAGRAHDLAAVSCADLLFVSSSEVYGRDGRHDEASDLVVPHRRGARMEYAIGKLGAEHVLFNRASDSGVRLLIVRPFNCAGPGQSPGLGFVVPIFVRAALAGTPLPVHGDGSARRAFCHVSDLVDGLVAVTRHGTAGGVYNVGQDGDVVSILELARRVIERCNSSSSIELVDPRTQHGRHWLDAFEKVPDITRVRQDTGWVPQHGLQKIIDDVAMSLGVVRT
jgi:nucleoside-diphosphate-sugar epimerase